MGLEWAAAEQTNKTTGEMGCPQKNDLWMWLGQESNLPLKKKKKESNLSIPKKKVKSELPYICGHIPLKKKYVRAHIQRTAKSILPLISVTHFIPKFYDMHMTDGDGETKERKKMV